MQSEREDETGYEVPTPEQIVGYRELLRNVAERLDALEEDVGEQLWVRFGLEVDRPRDGRRSERRRQSLGLKQLRSIPALREHWETPELSERVELAVRIQAEDHPAEALMTPAQGILRALASSEAQGIARYAMSEGKCRVRVESARDHIEGLACHPHFVVEQQGEWYEVTVRQ